MPQLDFDAAIAANDTSDVDPVELHRYAPGGTSPGGRALDGAWAPVEVPRPYVVLPAKPIERARRGTGTRKVEAVGLICRTRVQVAGAVPLGKHDRLLRDGRWWVAHSAADWLRGSNYYTATFYLADEPEGEP